MLRSDYDGQTCSVARTLELVGERWTLLIVRDAFLGRRRFEEFQRSLGVARNILATRLERLVEAGILRRERYSEHPPRDEYRLTEKGIDLWPVIFELVQWGDRYEAPAGPPVLLSHRGCSGLIDAHRRCQTCGAEVGAREVRALAGPGGGLSAAA
ncbi:MAG TPA: helix-turn-helix domain-containing protein [Solirubrobacteraceae bacterium]|nr:helix-turn-helix domain-containing protein [Solirubrobacteraceae bacterium]